MKKLSKTNSIIALIITVLIVAGGVVAYKLLMPHTSQDTQARSASFEFDPVRASGWWAAESMGAESLDATESGSADVLAARRVIAQGTKEQPTGDCFVMYSYFANSKKEPEDVLKSITSPGDSSTAGAFTLEPTQTRDLSMKLFGNDVQFQFHEFNKLSPDAADMSAGEGYAIIKAGTGYVQVQGVCKTAEQLADALPVFSAVSLKE